MKAASERQARRTAALYRTRRFWVGDVEIKPSSGQIAGPGGTQKLDPKVMAVLIRLATEDGQIVSRDTLMKDVWRDLVVTDFALSRCIYQLRKALSAVAQSDTQPIETLPKRGYRLTWDVMTTKSGKTKNSATFSPASLVGPGLLLAALVGLAVLLQSRFQITGTEHSLVDSSPVRVAVMPLDDLSEDSSQSLFANGLTREIMHGISEIPDVVTIGRGSVYTGDAAAWSDMEKARRLDAEFLVSGSVRGIGIAKRILIDLRSVSSGEQLWSHSYLVEPDAPFVVLAGVAKSVAQALERSANSEAGKSFTQNLPALEAYMQAYGTSNIVVKRQLLSKAVELDPHFVAAWSRLAGIEVMQVWNGHLSVEDAWDRSKPYLDRAFEINSDSPAPWVTLGRFERELGNPYQAIAAFERALELDPGNNWASANLGLVLRMVGQYEEALAIHELAVRMDPLSPAAQTRLGTSNWLLENYDEAVRCYQIAVDLDPGWEETYDSWAGMLSAGLGRYDEALQMIRRKMTARGEPTVRSLVTASYFASILGLDDAAINYQLRAIELNPGHTLFPDSQRYLIKGEDQLARDAAQVSLDMNPADTEAHLTLATLDLENDEPDAFYERVREAFPAFFDVVPNLDRSQIDSALLVALAYSAVGMEDSKLKLLQSVEAEIGIPHSPDHVSMATMYAMRGETAQAIQHLRLSPPGRVRGSAALMMRDPRFASLRDDEQFRALIADHLAEIRKQVTRVNLDADMLDGLPVHRSPASPPR